MAPDAERRRRDEHARLYTAFEPALALRAAQGMEMLVDE
jgi:hypothetical protein